MNCCSSRTTNWYVPGIAFPDDIQVLLSVRLKSPPVGFLKHTPPAISRPPSLDRAQLYEVAAGVCSHNTELSWEPSLSRSRLAGRDVAGGVCEAKYPTSVCPPFLSDVTAAVSGRLGSAMDPTRAPCCGNTLLPLLCPIWAWGPRYRWWGMF